MKLWQKIGIILGCSCIIGGGYVYDVAKHAPSVNENTLKFKAKSTKIYDSNGNCIYNAKNFNQDYLPYNEIPMTYQNAIISTEDKNFWHDKGVSPKDTIKAIIETLLHGSTAGVGGGSTITQQLVKLSVFSTALKDRTIHRKIQDIWISYQLSYKIPKKKILEFYINRIFEGQNSYGAETISEIYYNKPLKDLNLSQTAYIAGIGQAPSIYNLYENPKICEQRRNNVLLAMLNNHKITKDQYQNAKSTPITYGLIPQKESQEIQENKNFPNYQQNKAYIQSILQQLHDEGIDIKNKNSKIYSNLNENDQMISYNELQNNSIFNDPSMNNKQAALTLENPNDGAILAQVGGRNINGKENNINRAVETNRSSGSAIKPILDYAPAIEYLRWGTDHQVEDVPYDYRGTHLQVHDWDNKYEGKISMEQALVQSRNVPAIRTLEQVGLNRATKFMNQFGIPTIGNATPMNAIGIDTSTADLAGAYSAFSTLGMYYKQSYINHVNVDGIDHQLNDTQGNMIMTNSTAFIINKILEKAINDSNGCAHGAQINNLIQAGKTGTVSSDVSNQNPNDVIDLWMCGYTPANKENNSGLSCSIWVGADKPNSPNGKIPEQYQGIAQILYKNIMEQIATKQKLQDWKKPDDVKQDGDNYSPIYSSSDDNVQSTQGTQGYDSSLSSSVQSSSSMNQSQNSSSSSSVQNNSSSIGFDEHGNNQSSYNPDIPSSEDQINAVGKNQMGNVQY